MSHALPSLPLEAGATKTCTKCGETKSLPFFEQLPGGAYRGQCRHCRIAMNVERKRAARAAFKQTAVYRAHLDRKQREREAREAAKEYRRAQRRAELGLLSEAEKATKAAAEAERRAKAKAAADRRATRKALEDAGGPEAAGARVDYLAALLARATTKERLETDAGWEATMTELQRLWLVSGDKACVRCGQTFPSEQVWAPSPGVTYAYHCRPCASEAYEAHRRETFGPLIGPLAGARRIPLRDGTSITIAELARRHREREAGHRIKHFSR